MENISLIYFLHLNTKIRFNFLFYPNEFQIYVEHFSGECCLKIFPNELVFNHFRLLKTKEILVCIIIQFL